MVISFNEAFSLARRFRRERGPNGLLFAPTPRRSNAFYEPRNGTRKPSATGFGIFGAGTLSTATNAENVVKYLRETTSYFASRNQVRRFDRTVSCERVNNHVRISDVYTSFLFCFPKDACRLNVSLFADLPLIDFELENQNVKHESND